MVFELRSSEKSELNIFWLFRKTIQVSDNHHSQEKRLKRWSQTNIGGH